MGTASDSVSVNNTTQIPTHETRVSISHSTFFSFHSSVLMWRNKRIMNIFHFIQPRKNSVFSLIQVCNNETYIYIIFMLITKFYLLYWVISQVIKYFTLLSDVNILIEVNKILPIHDLLYCLICLFLLSLMSHQREKEERNRWWWTKTQEDGDRYIL